MAKYEIVIPSLEAIYVPAKKTEYYSNRLPESMEHLIVELPK